MEYVLVALILGSVAYAFVILKQHRAYEERIDSLTAEVDQRTEDALLDLQLEEKERSAMQDGIQELRSSAEALEEEIASAKDRLGSERARARSLQMAWEERRIRRKGETGRT